MLGGPDSKEERQKLKKYLEMNIETFKEYKKEYEVLDHYYSLKEYTVRDSYTSGSLRKKSKFRVIKGLKNRFNNYMDSINKFKLY